MSKHRFSTGLTETSSRKVFHDGCAKRDIFSQQILYKNRLCLAHCALNRSFTVCHAIEPQIISHLIVKDKVTEQHILEKYSNCNSFGVTMDLLNSQNFKVAITQLSNVQQV